MELRAWGRSMWPLIPPGSTLEIEPLDGNEPARGQIVVGVRSERVIAHRVVRIDHDDDGTGYAVVTRGDALEFEDPPWRAGELLGVVRAVRVRGVRVPLDGELARTAGRAVVERRAEFDTLLRLARPAERLFNAAAAAATLGASRLGLVRADVRTLAGDDERDLDGLLLGTGLETGSRGVPPLRESLDAGAVIGAFLPIGLAGALIPPVLAGFEPGLPVMVIAPHARGSVELPLLAAAALRAIDGARLRGRPAEWQRTIYASIGLRAEDAPDGSVVLRIKAD